MAASCTLAVSPAFAASCSPSSSSRRSRRFGVVAMASVGQKVYAPGVAVSEGNGGLPKIILKSPHGSEAEIYLFGACVTSWKVPNGKDLLFVRPDAVFNGQKPISGGIPHCFPQFGPGPMQQHGFARNVNWSVTDSEVNEGDPAVTLELKDDSYSRSMWDFSFQASYKVALHSTSLSTTLKITNTDDKPFSFNSALHTYFSASIAGVSVKGLKGSKTLNKDPDPKNPLEGKEERDEVTFPGFVDCVYLGAPSELILDNGLGDKIAISNENWSDAVLWNPHLQMEACYKDFVCVENAKIETVQLGPTQSWVAEQKIELI
ncbi:putative glucose-6-phosphate 1-epimerase [Brachypodium distachyon]|nr:putative glucose-6-phosphate 1-epimerase [Brachypodium distachyon]|eukprot:XP_003577994.1 putative glucose-6-phosphate 1-epimerase [Brachypodium distachyon]